MSLVPVTIFREFQKKDRETILNISRVINLFVEREIEDLKSMMENYFHRDPSSRDKWIVLVDQDSDIPQGVAYYAPEPFGDRVYNLIFLAVAPECQNKGFGSRLMNAVEKDTRSMNGRVLLVETSSLPKQLGAQKFYLKLGFHLEATIRDYYAEGDDKLVYYKKLH